MMAELSELTCWSASVVPKSKLSHTVTAHHGIVPKLSRHGGKTIKTVSYEYMGSNFSVRSLFFSP